MGTLLPGDKSYIPSVFHVQATETLSKIGFIKYLVWLTYRVVGTTYYFVITSQNLCNINGINRRISMIFV